MNTKNILLIVCIFILVVFIFGCTNVVDKKTTSVTQDSNNKLPNSFIMNISVYDSSESGNRYHYENLVYVNGNLVYGWKKYIFEAASGQNYVNECIADIDSLTWIPVGNSHWIPENSTNCQGNKYLTKKNIEENINSGEWNQLVVTEKCSPHFGDICYTLSEN